MLCQKRYFEVLVRVIEGRDLDTGALRVRAMLDGSQKATRISTSGVPKWKQVKKIFFFVVNGQFFHAKLKFSISINYQIQNLQFTLKNVSLQKLAVMMLTLKVGKCNKYDGKY